MAVEEWRPIEGYEELYAVSSQGRVKRLVGVKARKERILKPWLLDRGRGYPMVYLCREAKRKSFLIHRLVAKAFIPNPGKLEQVNHKDGNSRNNLVENLEWVTNQQNTIHAYENGLNSKSLRYRITDLKTGETEEYHSGRAASLAVGKSVGWMYWAVRAKGANFQIDNYLVEEIGKAGENHVN